MRDAYFPTKFQWKRILRKHVYEYEYLQRMSRLTASCTAIHIDNMFSFNKPCHLWLLGRSNLELKHKCFTAVSVLNKLFCYNKCEHCPMCKLFVDNSNVHIIYFCSKTERLREALWSTILHRAGIDAYLLLISKDVTSQICDLLDGLSTYSIDEKESDHIQIASVSILYTMFRLVYKHRHI